MRKAAICFVMCHLSAWNNSAVSGRILMKFGIWVFFENMSTKFKVGCNTTRIAGAAHVDLHTLMIASHWTLLRMRNVADDIYGEENTYFIVKTLFYQNKDLYSVIFFFFQKLCRLWDSVEKRGRAGLATDDIMIGHLRFLCWINKAIDTHWKYVILIAFHGKKNGYTNVT